MGFSFRYSGPDAEEVGFFRQYSSPRTEGVGFFCREGVESAERVGFFPVSNAAGKAPGVLSQSSFWPRIFGSFFIRG